MYIQFKVIETNEVLWGEWDGDMVDACGRFYSHWEIELISVDDK